MEAPFKNILETLLIRSGVARFGRRSKRDYVLVLAFHNIVEDGMEGGGDASLHLPRSRFAAFLDHLTECHEVVPLPSVTDPRQGASRSKPRVVITFDDAYHGAVTIGVSELAGRGLPATIFVAPAFIGGKSFWWDSFAPVQDPGQFEAFRTEALQRLRGEDHAVREWALDLGLEGAPAADSLRTATESELRSAIHVHPSLTLGSHSWSHPNLTELSESEVREELSRSIAWLHERFELVVPWLSYPYGLTSRRIESIAAEVGYEGATLIEGGWASTRVDRAHAVPRLNIPAGLSPGGFVLRTAGL